MKRFNRSHPPVRQRLPRRPLLPHTIIRPPAQTHWQRRALWLRNHPVIVILEALGLAGIIIAVGLFVYELRERQEERIARSWHLLTTDAPGNSGKREALEYLNSQYGCIRGLEFIRVEIDPDPLKWRPPPPDLMLFWNKSQEIGFNISRKPTWCWKQQVVLTGINLSQAAGSSGTYLKGVDLSGADLTEANLAGAVLEDADLSGAILDRAILSRANLSGARLHEASFTAADFANADLAGADARNARFWRASLVGTDLRNADVSNSYFEKANLTGAKIASVNLSNANFTNAVTKFIDWEEYETFSYFGDWGWMDFFLMAPTAWYMEGLPPIAAPKNLQDKISARKTGENDDVFLDRLMWHWVKNFTRNPHPD